MVTFPNNISSKIKTLQIGISSHLQPVRENNVYNIHSWKSICVGINHDCDFDFCSKHQNLFLPQNFKWCSIFHQWVSDMTLWLTVSGISLFDLWPDNSFVGFREFESGAPILVERSKRSMPDTVSHITHSLIKDEVPSENFEVGINFWTEMLGVDT